MRCGWRSPPGQALGARRRAPRRLRGEGGSLERDPAVALDEHEQHVLAPQPGQQVRLATRGTGRPSPPRRTRAGRAAGRDAADLAVHVTGGVPGRDHPGLALTFSIASTNQSAASAATPCATGLRCRAATRVTRSTAAAAAPGVRRRPVQPRRGTPSRARRRTSPARSRPGSRRSSSRSTGRRGGSVPPGTNVEGLETAVRPRTNPATRARTTRIRPSRAGSASTRARRRVPPAEAGGTRWARIPRAGWASLSASSTSRAASPVSSHAPGARRVGVGLRCSERMPTPFVGPAGKLHPHHEEPAAPVHPGSRSSACWPGPGRRRRSIVATSWRWDRRRAKGAP